MNKKEKITHLFGELRAHLPYTVFSVAFGMIILGFLSFVAELISGASDIAVPAQGLYHVFHPVHLLFSAIATTAMFWRHEKKLFKAIFIGFIGSLGICGISDIFIPYISGMLLGSRMHLHICIIEHPFFIFPFVIIGVFTGLIMPDSSSKSTVLSHSAHVLVSSMASILYLIGFGLLDWIHVAGMVFIYTILAVIIPCCTSDIVFPLLFVRKTDV